MCDGSEGRICDHPRRNCVKDISWLRLNILGHTTQSRINGWPVTHHLLATKTGTFVLKPMRMAASWQSRTEAGSLKRYRTTFVHPNPA
jgi:hypothetical protein